jgi:hypothetical protein
MGEAVHRLAEAIGYPDTIPSGVATFTLRVDGMEILAEERGDRLLLRYNVTDIENLFGRLAEFAAGRMLKEDAKLSAEPSSGGLFLWQSVDSRANAHDLLRFFETFTASCDWWRERVESIHEEGPQLGPDEMVMRP